MFSSGGSAQGSRGPGLKGPLVSWRLHRARVSGFGAVFRDFMAFSPSSLEDIRGLRVIKMKNGQESESFFL